MPLVAAAIGSEPKELILLELVRFLQLSLFFLHSTFLAPSLTTRQTYCVAFSRIRAQLQGEEAGEPIAKPL